mgnify:CR=1 FL=1
MKRLNNLPCISENQKVIILNPRNKKWVRMPTQIYDFYLNKDEGEKELCDYLHKKYKLFEEKNRKLSILKSVYFTVTGKCNLCCSFCTMESGPETSTENDLTLKEIRNIVLPKLRKLKPQKIVITGGEPFVRKDLKKIISMMSKYFDKNIITLQTNGLLINKKEVDFLCNNIGAIEFSIENLFSNIKDLKKMKEIFELLKNRKIILSFSFVAHSATKRYLENALELCNEFNAYFILRPVAILGRAKDKHKIDILQEEREKIVLYMEVLQYIIKKHYFTENICGLFLMQPILRNNCGAFGNIMALQPNGTVYMCENLRNNRYDLGNIRTDSVYQIKKTINTKMSNPDYKEEFLVKPLMCKTCKASFFCPGPCIAERDEYSSNICYIKKWLIEFNLFYVDKGKTIEENLRKLLFFLENKYHEVYCRK